MGIDKNAQYFYLKSLAEATDIGEAFCDVIYFYLNLRSGLVSACQLHKSPQQIGFCQNAD